MNRKERRIARRIIIKNSIIEWNINGTIPNNKVVSKKFSCKYLICGAKHDDNVYCAAEDNQPIVPYYVIVPLKMKLTPYLTEQIKQGKQPKEVLRRLTSYTKDCCIDLCLYGCRGYELCQAIEIIPFSYYHNLGGGNKIILDKIMLNSCSVCWERRCNNCGYCWEYCPESSKYRCDDCSFPIVTRVAELELGQYDDSSKVSTLLDDFLLSKELDYKDVLTSEHSFKDRTLANEWKMYHKEHFTLQNVCVNTLPHM